MPAGEKKPGKKEIENNNIIFKYYIYYILSIYYISIYKDVRE